MSFLPFFFLSLRPGSSTLVYLSTSTMSSSKQLAVHALWQQVDDILVKYLPLTASGTLSKIRGEIGKLFIDYERASGTGGPGSSLLERSPLSVQPLHRASTGGHVAMMSSANVKPFSLFSKRATAPQNSLASQRREEQEPRSSVEEAVETNNSSKHSLKHQSTSQDEDGDEYMGDEGDDGYGDSESDDDDDYNMTDRTYIDEVGDLSDESSIENGNAIDSCMACLEDRVTTDLIKFPCGDLYCRLCLHQLIESSVQPLGTFPPRCCGVFIEYSAVRHLLRPDLAATFGAKSLRLAAPSLLHCHSLSCHGTMQQDGRNASQSSVQCIICGKRTCTACKGPSHRGNCPPDPAKDQLLALAKQERWQQCYRCQSLVELSAGCSHISMCCF